MLARTNDHSPNATQFICRIQMCKSHSHGWCFQQVPTRAVSLYGICRGTLSSQQVHLPSGYGSRFVVRVFGRLRCIGSMNLVYVHDMLSILTPAQGWCQTWRDGVSKKCCNHRSRLLRVWRLQRQRRRWRSLKMVVILRTIKTNSFQLWRRSEANQGWNRFTHWVMDVVVSHETTKDRQQRKRRPAREHI